MDDTIRLRDVVQVELEQLEEYGEAAQEFFHGLSGDIKREFTDSLETLLTHDLPAFQSQVTRALTRSSLGDAGGALGGLFGSVVGDVVGAALPGAYGDVFGSAISGAIRRAAQDLARYGSLDMGRVIAAGNNSGGRTLGGVIRRGELPMSDSQRSAEAWAALGRGQRNL